MPGKSVVKPTPQQIRARKEYTAIPSKTKADDPKTYTKVPHRYGDVLIMRGKLGGALQRDLVYWIERYTWGDPKRPEFARLSIGQLAKLCQVWDDDKNALRPVERKSIATALKDLEKRGIVTSRDRKGCSATTVKMYKLTPEKWANAPAYRPPDPKDAAILDESEEEATKGDGSEEIAAPGESTQPVAVESGRQSKPQPLALRPSAKAEPVTIRVVYNPLGFDAPVTFRAHAGANGRLTVTATHHKHREEKANDCSRAQLQSKRTSVDSERFTEFSAITRAIVDQAWQIPASQTLIQKVLAAAGDCPADVFARVAWLRLKRPKSGDSPGLLVKLAQEARNAWRASKAQQTPVSNFLPSTYAAITPEELAEIDRQVEEARREFRALVGGDK